MHVHVLTREDRNQHGYIDTSIIGVYRELKLARLERLRDRRRAIAEGLDVNYSNPHGDTWEVYWKIEGAVLE